MQDMILALCVLAGSAVYLRAAIDLPKLQFGDPLGPQAFPCLIAFGLAISGVMLIIQTLSRKPVDMVAAVLLIIFAIPVLVSSLRKKAERDRDHLHPSR